ncbi:MAG TPA: hypothetical protein VEL72_02970 [Ktedonobacteraceae bacterium]|nr:hypothetical protein [Ktedonobacteraceae bacterium]
MPFMLVTLLAFALLVTLAGFFLSVKSQARNQNVIYPSARTGRRSIEVATSGTTRSTRAIAQRSTLSIPSFGGRVRGRQAGEPVPWTVVVIGLVSIFVLGLFTLNAVFPRNAVFSTVLFANGSQSTPPPDTIQEHLSGISQSLVRISQLDPAQYNSPQDFNTWAYSACSTASMTEVINAYGHHYRIADILKVEASLHEITPALGLVEDVGIQRTAARFGFKTSWGYKLSLDQIIATANYGTPIIVGFPPQKYAGGHLLVVLGGNSSVVFLADSSLYNHTSLTRAQFLKWWGGFSAILSPN